MITGCECNVLEIIKSKLEFHRLQNPPQMILKYKFHFVASANNFDLFWRIHG